MLLEKRERMVIVNIIDRYYFESTRSMDEKEKRSAMTAAFQDVVEQYERINKDPYDVMRNHLQFVIDNRYFLTETLEKFQFKDVVHFYEIGNKKVEQGLSDFRSFVVICGFNNFKNYLMELDE